MTVNDDTDFGGSKSRVGKISLNPPAKDLVLSSILLRLCKAIERHNKLHSAELEATLDIREDKYGNVYHHYEE